MRASHKPILCAKNYQSL